MVTAIPIIIATTHKKLVNLSFDFIASIRKTPPRQAPAILKEGIHAMMRAIIDLHKGRFWDFVAEVEFIDYSLPNVLHHLSRTAGATDASERSEPASGVTAGRD